MTEKTDNLKLSVEQLDASIDGVTKLLQDPNFRDSAGAYIKLANNAAIRVPEKIRSTPLVTRRVPDLTDLELETLSLLLERMDDNLITTIEKNENQKLLAAVCAKLEAKRMMRSTRREFLVSLGATGGLVAATAVSGKLFISGVHDDRKGVYIRADQEAQLKYQSDPRDLRGRSPLNLSEELNYQEFKKEKSQYANSLVERYFDEVKDQSGRGLKILVGAVGGVVGAVFTLLSTAPSWDLFKKWRESEKELAEKSYYTPADNTTSKSQ